MDKNLQQAINIATNAHKGQKDKGGRDYIFHPIRVMHMLETKDEMIVGILHDTIEDTEVTYEFLIEKGFTNEIVDALRCLTRLEGDSYSRFIEKAKSNKLSRAVKIADLMDNMNLSRLKNVTKIDIDRNKKYEKALKRLLKED